MKVALLCDFAFWEGRLGSSVRVESLCHSLSKVCDMTVICSLTLPSKYRTQLLEAPYQFYDRRRLEYEVKKDITPPLPGVRADRQVVVKGINRVLQVEGYDAVITPYFNREWMIAHLPKNIVNIVDTIDCQSQRARSFAVHGLTPKFILTPEAEGALLDRYDMALALSEPDQAEFFELSKTPMVTAPFRLPPKPCYTVRQQSNSVLFIAAQSDVNNMTLSYLMEQVLPLVNRDIELNIVGNVTIPDITSPNVTVIRHEGVDDLREIYSTVDLALNPTYAGGGIKTKTLEAIAFGVPVITSDEGARGLLNLLPETLIANDKETFAHRINTLLQDPVKRLILSKEMCDRLENENSDSWLEPFVKILSVKIDEKRRQFST